jgi:hypothetical protein
MGSKKGNVKIRRKCRRLQLIEKIGSSGWIRTSNPPVNSRARRIVDVAEPRNLVTRRD